jgi:hypothetical protein
VLGTSGDQFPVPASAPLIVFPAQGRATLACCAGAVGWWCCPQVRNPVAANTGTVHTPTMTLKNAALLALIGAILMTALLLWTFVFNFLNVLRGLVPAAMLFSSFIYAFGCFSVMVFFFVFHRAQ